MPFLRKYRAHSKTIVDAQPQPGAYGGVLGAGVQTSADTKHAVGVTPGVTSKQCISQGAFALNRTESNSVNIIFLIIHLLQLDPQ